MIRVLLADDDELLRAGLAMLIDVAEAYLHCAKSIMRSKLWDLDAQIDRAALPSMGAMLKDQIGSSEAAESQSDMIERYRKALY